MAPLILASASPRRRALLDELGLSFEVRPADVDEGLDEPDPARHVAALAARKAETVAADVADGTVLAADTVGALDGVILGKPRDDAHAVAMLSALSGRTLQVMTGLTVRRVARGETVAEASAVSTTQVTFHLLDDAAIRAYVATGECRDKAGAYAIQGLAGAFVSRIAGSYHNVVGLPVDVALGLLRRVDHELPAHLRVPAQGGAP